MFEQMKLWDQVQASVQNPPRMQITQVLSASIDAVSLTVKMFSFVVIDQHISK